MVRRSAEEQIEDKALVLGRLMTEHFLRQVEVLARMQDGDLIKALIFIAIISANVRHVTEDPELSARYSTHSSVVPEDMRAPISVNAISASLAIPYETTRRYVNKLIAEGQCRRVDERGVIVPLSAVQTILDDRLIEMGVTNLRKFINALDRAGYDFGLK